MTKLANFAPIGRCALKLSFSMDPDSWRRFTRITVGFLLISDDFLGSRGIEFLSFPEHDKRVLEREHTYTPFGNMINNLCNSNTPSIQPCNLVPRNILSRCHL